MLLMVATIYASILAWLVVPVQVAEFSLSERIIETDL